MKEVKHNAHNAFSNFAKETGRNCWSDLNIRMMEKAGNGKYQNNHFT